MEPVPVTRTVRRTVRMAVALVVGQALLCALIGWLTLGQSHSARSGPPGSVVDQMAAPPPVDPAPPSARAVIAPTTQARRPAPVSTETARSAPRKAASSAAPERPATTAPTTRQPSPINIAPEPPELVPPEPPATTAPSTTAPSTTAPSPTATRTPPAPSISPGRVQRPVRVGDECRPTGAYGRTADGVLVRCLREWGHGPRWKIV